MRSRLCRMVGPSTVATVRSSPDNTSFPTFPPKRNRRIKPLGIAMTLTMSQRFRNAKPRCTCQRGKPPDVGWIRNKDNAGSAM